jgi:hypothetical protein
MSMAFISPSRTTALRLARGLWLVALAVGLSALGGSVAKADSCGHYVKRLGPGFVPGKAALAVVNNLHDKQSPSPTDVPCGCRGPECHRAPLAPAPANPPVPVRSHSQQDLVALVDAGGFAGLSNAHLVSQISAQPRSGFPLLLDRPPNL